MQKLKFSKMTVAFMSVSAFFAAFGLANLALWSFTPYRFYLFGFFGVDFVWLSAGALTVTVGVWLCAVLVRAGINTVLKAVLVTALVITVAFILTVCFAGYAFDNENGDQYRFISPDGSVTLMVCEAVEFPVDSLRYDVYRVENPFILRFLGGDSFDIGIDADVPNGDYVVDWSGDEPVVTPR